MHVCRIGMCETCMYNYGRTAVYSSDSQFCDTMIRGFGTFNNTLTNPNFEFQFHSGTQIDPTTNLSLGLSSKHTERLYITANNTKHTERLYISFQFIRCDRATQEHVCMP